MEAVENEVSISIANGSEEDVGYEVPDGAVGGKDGLVVSKPLEESVKSEQRVSVLNYVPSMKVRLFSPPRQRQKWGSDQILPHVNWGDLFFDLFFVAGFYNLGNILVDNPSGIGVLYFCGCFFPLSNLWTVKVMYDSQYVYGEDIWHKIFDTGVLVVLATAVSYISVVPKLSNPSRNVEMFGLALSLTLGNAVNALRYVECFLFGRGQRRRIKFMSRGTIMVQSISGSFYLAAAIVSGIYYFGNSDDYDGGKSNQEGYKEGYGENRILAGEEADCDSSNINHIPIVLLLLGYVANSLYIIIRIGFCFPGFGEHKKISIPMHIDFLIHRQGEWIMLVLGESVLSLLIVDAKGGDYYRTFYFGIVTVILLHVLHFRSQPLEADAHAMRRHKNAGICYGQLFPIYSAALVAVGASYKLCLYSLNDGGGYRRERQLVSALSIDDYHNRGLAGGGDDDGCSPTGDERTQLIAHLFCGAMAIVFVCFDLMNLAHSGWIKKMEQCKLGEKHCERTGVAIQNHNLLGIVLVFVPRVVTTVFIAMLSQWETNPVVLAVLGFVAVICQLMTRFLGFVLFNNNRCNDNQDNHHHHHGGVSDDEDDELGVLEDSERVK